MIVFDNFKVFTDNIDEKAMEQLKELAETDVFAGLPVRIMPDVHAGAGCVIGFTAPVGNKVIPNIVGVDIGCGMLCVYLGKIKIDFSLLDTVIREHIPAGRSVGDFHADARGFIARLRCKEHMKKIDWLEGSLGTLGGGNHFIEIDEDGGGGKYLVVHSGSRNLGKQVAEHYQELAVKECLSFRAKEIIELLKAQGRESEIQSVLRKEKTKAVKLPKPLCYLQGESMKDYLHDMAVCMKFADRNRGMMGEIIIRQYNGALRGQKRADFFAAREQFTTRHNYISADNYIRKGAIEAREGQRVLIPLNMRDGCIIGIGKGNPDWNYSAPHGAGRIMSRMEARSRIALGEFREAMKDIFTTTVSAETLDEAPFAYKPSAEIIELVQESVEIERIIKPIYNFKAAE